MMGCDVCAIVLYRATPRTASLRSSTRRSDPRWAEQHVEGGAGDGDGTGDDGEAQRDRSGQHTHTHIRSSCSSPGKKMEDAKLLADALG